MNKRSKNELSLELLAARFTYASAAVLTISDLLATIAAGLALRSLEENSPTSEGDQTNTSRQASSSTNSQSMFSVEMEQTQQQIDALIRELKHLKKMMRF